MATEKTYLVQLIHGFEAPRRITAGIEVPNRGAGGNDGYVGPLTKEQLAEIMGDRYMTVTVVKQPAEKPQEAPKDNKPQPSPDKSESDSAKPTEPTEPTEGK